MRTRARAPAAASRRVASIPFHPRHAHVHQNHVWVQPSGHEHRFVAITGFTHNLDPGWALSTMRNPAPR
jgi:hypothetical protein